MVENFTYHEALLGLTHVVGWADGANQNSETDAKVQMIMHEQIPTSTLENFKIKKESLGNHDATFDYSIQALKGCSSDQKINACAWMYSIALVAATGLDGELDYDHDKWIVNNSNVDAEEKVWVDKAIAALGLSEQEVRAAYDKLPEIKRI